MDLLLIGVDAACDPVLERVFERDAAPTLRGLVDDGVSAPLESQIPPWTPSAWPSLYTGVNPGKHGVFDFLRFDGYDWDLVDATDVRAWALWELLDRHGLGSVVVNVPVTGPPRPFDGALIPGYVAPEDPPCHPDGVLDDVRAEVGDYRLYSAHAGEPTREERVAEYRRLAGFRGEAFRYLAGRFDPDFGFLQFQVTDTVFHECPGDWDAVADVYAAVDDQVAAVLDACDPATTVVASDHGIGPYGGYEFRANEFLRREGYVETVRGGEGMPAWKAVRDDRSGTAGTNGTDGDGGSPARSVAGTAADVAEGLVSAAARVGLTSQRIGRVLRRVGLEDAVLRVVPEDLVRAGTERVDFANSRAYMRSRTECGVRLNVAGREPAGRVDADEYGAVRDALVERLESVRTPDGDPVFEAVGPREAFFEGPYVEEAVDVVTVPAAFDQFLSAGLRGEVFGEPSEPYNHKRDGVVVATGADVDEAAVPTDAHLFDVAPTVLSLLGVARDERMDGDVLPFAPPGEAEAYPAYPADEGTTGADDRGDGDARDDVEDRLRDLGYLERT